MLQERNAGGHHHTIAMGATHMKLIAYRILKSWLTVTRVIAVNYRFYYV